MKSFLALIFTFTVTVSYSQTKTLPSWYSQACKSKALDKKYDLASFLKPSFIQADFNGDGTPDVAALVLETKTKKRGILLIHNNTLDYFVFGAGISFDNSDNFDWAEKWLLYTEKIAFETQFDKKTGDILGGKKVKLARPGILIWDYEDGSPYAGGIIYWNGKKYIWIHQGE
jgi:hypothetical protein